MTEIEKKISPIPLDPYLKPHHFAAEAVMAFYRKSKDNKVLKKCIRNRLRI